MQKRPQALIVEPATEGGGIEQPKDRVCRGDGLLPALQPPGPHDGVRPKLHVAPL